MGLPRDLQSKLREFQKLAYNYIERPRPFFPGRTNLTPVYEQINKQYGGKFFKSIMDPLLRKHRNRKPHNNAVEFIFHLADTNRILDVSLSKWWIRKQWKRTVQPSDLDMTRVDVLLYQGIDEFGRVEYRKVRIPKYFREKFEQINTRRIACGREEAEWQTTLLKMRHKVYKSRQFPHVLRNLIWRRDNYTCQICLMDRGKLRIEGRHLEVDHIEAWVDGGLTTYSNGQTICDSCNKAKHHAKKYLWSSKT